MITDFHSHVLPGLDDGSASLEESIAMLRMASEQGIRHVIATPHFYPRHDSPERFLTRRARADAILREEMAKYDDLPKLSLGAEVYFFQGISDSDEIQALTINKTGCILLEMPGSPWTDSMYHEIEQLRAKQGLIPLIAHVDRYIGPLRTYGIPERLAELPVLVQANASFFLRTATRGMAMRLLRNRKIHLLGSDCHNLTDRKPNLGLAVSSIEQKLGSDTISWIESNETYVLQSKNNI